MWEWRLTTWEEYRSIVRAFKDATGKTKAHLELNLMTEIKGNKKGHYNCIRKRKNRENVDPLVNGSENHD